MHKGPRHHLLVPSQYMGSGQRVKVFKECGLEVGRREGLFWVPTQGSLREMSCWDDISPKRSK